MMKRFGLLISKDWRLNRAITFGLFIVTALAYALGVIDYLWDRYHTVVHTQVILNSHNVSTVPAPEVGDPLSSYLRIAAVSGIFFTVLAAAVFGAAGFAIERRERSADFLAMLPVKRRDIIMSKLLLALNSLGSALAINVLVLIVSNLFRQWDAVPALIWNIFAFIASGLCLYGVAWVLSTFMSSTAIAASAAIVVVGCASAIFAMVMEYDARKDLLPEPAVWALGIAGIIFIAAGNIYYTRRTAP